MRWFALFMISLAFAGCLGGDDGPTEVSEVKDPNDGLNETVTATIPSAYQPPFYPNDGASTVTVTSVESFDGYRIPIAIYKPNIASNETQMPVIIDGHGFTGSKKTAEDYFVEHIKAGFGVVTFDQRGHGDARATSEVTFMHPDAEVKDVIAIIDEIASWDWVLKEPNDPTDPVLGTMGYSYGGAFQLMGSIFDDRIDALVPEMTWNDITDALAPGGAINTGWVGAFYIAGNAQQSVTFSNDFHVGWQWAMSTNTLPAGQAPGVPDLVSLFDEVSPKMYPTELDKPTWLVQGMVDTLFPLNQAVANYEQLTANGADARLYTYLGGHVLTTGSIAPGTFPTDVGLQGGAGGRPCGEMEEIEIAWHQTHLLKLTPDLGPEICFGLEDGTAIVGDSWPLHDVNETIAIDLPAVLTSPVGAPNLFDLGVAADTVIAGIPKVTGTITAPSADTIVYFSLQILRGDGLFEHIVNDQVRPMRVNTPANIAVPFEIDMHGVGLKLAAGETLYLSISNVEPMYAANSNRVASAAVIEGIEITLPVVSDPQFL